MSALRDFVRTLVAAGVGEASAPLAAQQVSAAGACQSAGMLPPETDSHIVQAAAGPLQGATQVNMAGPAAARPDRAELERRAAGDLKEADARVAELDKQLQQRRSGRVAVEDALAERDLKQKPRGSRTDEQLLDELREKSAGDPYLKKVLEGENTGEWARLVAERRDAIANRQRIKNARDEIGRQSRREEEEAEELAEAERRMQERQQQPDGTGGERNTGEHGEGGGGTEATSHSPQSEISPAAVQDLANRVNNFDAPVKQLQEQVDALAKTELSPEALDVVVRTKIGAAKTYLATGEALNREIQALPESARKLEAIKGAAAKLANAVSLVQGIVHILEAGSATDALKRTAEVEINIGEAAVIQAITKSGVVTFLVTQLVQLPDDIGETKHRAIAEKAAAEAEERAIIEITAKLLQQAQPGSVEWNGGAPVIHNQKAWDQTIALVRKLVEQEKRKANIAVVEQAKYHARMLGLEDGMAGSRSHKHDDWDKVMWGGEVDDAYESAFREGDTRIQPYLQKARDLGTADRRAGNRQEHRDVPGTWFEFASARLTEAYDEGWNQADNSVGVGSETG